ncbi:MAG: hypothetical protein O7E52_26785 [Candidatus Poribacteria bacterium]|nr:hypothetical protein [Candidatus Poribacteria bacterium]
MTQTKTFGRFPTLGEMKAYYNRDDVLYALLYQCQRRSVTVALGGEHETIYPTSTAHLRDIINETIRTQIEPKFDDDAECSINLNVPVEVFWTMADIDVEKSPPPGYTFLWHGTTADRVDSILDDGFRSQGEGVGVYFSPKFGVSRHVAEWQAKTRRETPVIFRCLFKDDQLAQLNTESRKEYIFHPSYYLSLHANLTIADGEAAKGFDMVFESDYGNWRRCFESLLGPIQMLDDFGVFYRLKYSGARSLHVMIPFEAFPEVFNGAKVVEQWDELYRNINGYFFNRCQMGWVDRPKVLRLAYSLNEDNGMVSLPLSRAQVDDFRPWKANLHEAEFGRPWYDDVPADAAENTRDFLHEIFAEKKTWKAIGTSNYNDRQFRFSTWRGNDVWAGWSLSNSASEWVERLKSEDAKSRVEAAWHLMHANMSVPSTALEVGLTDRNADVRWYLTEAMNKTPTDETIRCAGRMVLNADSFVSASAVDLLIHAGRQPGCNLGPFWDGAFAFIGGLQLHAFRSFIALIEGMHATRTQAAWQSFAEYGITKIAAHLANVLTEREPYETMQAYLSILNQLCSPARFESDPAYFSMRATLVPGLIQYLATEAADFRYVLMLQRFWRKEALLIETIRQCGEMLSMAAADLPSTQTTPEADQHLRSLVCAGLTDLTSEEVSRLLEVVASACSTQLIPVLIHLLSRLGTADMVAVVTQAIKQRRGKQRQEIRRIATRTLGEIEGEQAVSLLIARLDDKHGGGNR